MMYELYTGIVSSTNSSLASRLSGLIAGLRPVFPHDTPVAFQDLAKACWSENPEERPSNDAIVETLKRISDETHTGGQGANLTLGKLIATGDGGVLTHEGSQICNDGMEGYVAPQRLRAVLDVGPSFDGYIAPSIIRGAWPQAKDVAQNTE